MTAKEKYKYWKSYVERDLDAAVNSLGFVEDTKGLILSLMLFQLWRVKAVKA